MKKELQRVRLAEFLGWRFSHPDRDFDIKSLDKAEADEIKMTAILCWYAPGDDYWQTQELPDCDDLNFLQEVWHKMHYNHQAEYAHHLVTIIFGKGLADGKLFGEHDLSRMSHAYADERREAMLRTLGMWEENNHE